MLGLAFDVSSEAAAAGLAGRLTGREGPVNTCQVSVNTHTLPAGQVGTQVRVVVLERRTLVAVLKERDWFEKPCW